eukprot:334877-Rhodomonas_salina.1
MVANWQQKTLQTASGYYYALAKPKSPLQTPLGCTVQWSAPPTEQHSRAPPGITVSSVLVFPSLFPSSGPLLPG